MSDASSPALRLEIREHVAHLILSRADAANTMNLQFGREFAAAAYAIRKDADVRAVLLPRGVWKRRLWRSVRHMPFAADLLEPGVLSSPVPGASVRR